MNSSRSRRMSWSATCEEERDLLRAGAGPRQRWEWEREEERAGVGARGGGGDPSPTPTPAPAPTPAGLEGTVTLQPNEDRDGLGGREAGEAGLVERSSEGRREEEAEEGRRSE